MSARRPRPYPRADRVDPSSKAYNKIIRLEGQICVAKDILRFVWAYSPKRGDIVEKFLHAARELYCCAIDDLMKNFLDLGIDLVSGARTAGGLVKMMRAEYFPLIEDEEREKEYHWPKILWFQKLQEILENEETSISEALVKGWFWFIDPEQWPCKSVGGANIAEMWTLIDAQEKEEILGGFALDANTLKDWLSGIASDEFDKSVNLQGPFTKCDESNGVVLEFRSLGTLLDIEAPRVTVPSSRHLSKCGSCYEDLKEADIGTDAEHKPVQTVCGHIFGNSCLWKWYIYTGDCPVCRKDLEETLVVTEPGDLLESCDRALKWLQPPVPFTVPETPHSFADKLNLLFEPVDDIRNRLSLWGPYADGVVSEWSRLKDLGMYLARDRLAAVVENDVVRYRNVVLLQVQVGARRLWLQFLRRVLPGP